MCEFDPKLVHVRFVVDKVAEGQAFLRGFGLFVSVHHCSIVIFLLALFVSGHPSEALVPSDYATLFRTSGSTEHKGSHISVIFLVVKAMPCLETVSRWPLTRMSLKLMCFVS